MKPAPPVIRMRISFVSKMPFLRQIMASHFEKHILSSGGRKGKCDINFTGAVLIHYKNKCKIDGR